MVSWAAWVISIGSADFAQLTRAQQTNTQTTLRTISVAIGRIYALRARDMRTINTTSTTTTTAFYYC